MSSRSARTWRITVCLLVVGSLSYASPEEEFQQANGLYESKDYDEAIALYSGILAQGVESSALYFNLGNAHFKAGDLGSAVLYYHKAKRLAPDDADIRDNLEFASSFTRVQMEGVRLNPIRSFVQEILEPYSVDTLAWTSSVVFILLFLLLTLRYGFGFHGSIWRASVTAVLTLTIVFSLVTTFKYRDSYLTMRGVLIAEECSVRTGPSDQSEVELEGAPGLVVEILSESGDYYNVLFENKRRGWVQKDLVAVI